MARKEMTPEVRARRNFWLRWGTIPWFGGWVLLGVASAFQGPWIVDLTLRILGGLLAFGITLMLSMPQALAEVDAIFDAFEPKDKQP